MFRRSIPLRFEHFEPTWLTNVLSSTKLCTLAFLTKVVKITKETIEKNGSDDKTLRFTNNNFVKFT